MRPMQRIRMGLLLANIKLGKLTRDAYSGPKDPNPENWRTISGAKVHLTNGKIDGGAGGKFHGNNWVGKEIHASDPRAQEGNLFGQYGWSVGESKTERETKEKKENLKKQLEEYHSLMINKQLENAENQAYYVYEAARELDPSSKEYKDAIKAIGWNEKDIEEVEEAIKNENQRESERQEKNKAAWERTMSVNKKNQATKNISSKKEGEKESTANESNKKTSTYTPVATIKEADEYITQKYGIQASYKGVDVIAANQWNESLTDSFDRFPELKSNFGFVGEAHQRYNIIKEREKQRIEDFFNSFYGNNKPANIDDIINKQLKKTMRRYNIKSNVYAQSYGKGSGSTVGLGGVCLNKAQAKSAKDMIESLKEDVKSGFHPIGCDTIKSVLDHEIGHQLDNLLNISTSSEFLSYYNKLTRDDIKKGLSEYANKKTREFVAEAWAEYCNNPTPRPISQKVGEIIENAYKKYKGATP